MIKKREPAPIEVKPVEVLSDAVNYVVLKTPGRNYPGMVIQGDSLAKLYRDACEVCRLAKLSGDAALQEEATALCEDLGERLAHYEKTLAAHGIDIPYHSPITNTAE